MILYPPIKFDANEWFFVIFFAIFYILSILLPKRFPHVFTLNIVLFVAFLGKFADFLLAADIPFDLYDYNDTPQLDLFDEYLHYLLYPVVGYLLTYIYDIWISKKYSKILFVLLCTAGCTSFEWIALKAHVFTYKGWKLSYSVPTYVILLTFLILFYHLMKRWIKIKRSF